MPVKTLTRKKVGDNTTKPCNGRIDRKNRRRKCSKAADKYFLRSLGNGKTSDNSKSARKDELELLHALPSAAWKINEEAANEFEHHCAKAHASLVTLGSEIEKDEGGCSLFTKIIVSSLNGIFKDLKPSKPMLVPALETGFYREIGGLRKVNMIKSRVAPRKQKVEHFPLLIIPEEDPPKKEAVIGTITLSPAASEFRRQRNNFISYPLKAVKKEPMLDVKYHGHYGSFKTVKKEPIFYAEYHQNYDSFTSAVKKKPVSGVKQGTADSVDVNAKTGLRPRLRSKPSPTYVHKRKSAPVTRIESSARPGLRPRLWSTSSSTYIRKRRDDPDMIEFELTSDESMQRNIALSNYSVSDIEQEVTNSSLDIIDSPMSTPKVSSPCPSIYIRKRKHPATTTRIGATSLMKVAKHESVIPKEANWHVATDIREELEKVQARLIQSDNITGIKTNLSIKIHPGSDYEHLQWPLSISTPRLLKKNVRVSAFLWNCIDCENGRVCLHFCQREKIIRGDLLSVSEVTAAMFLIKNKFTQFKGLEDIIHASIIKRNWLSGKFIQIMDTGDHWICVSNVFSPPDVVTVYDSCWDHHSAEIIPRRLKAVRSSSQVIRYERARLQQQQGDRDSGVFAVAFAASIAFGENPEHFYYRQYSLREHLVKCFDTVEIEPFPNTIQLLKSQKNT